MKYFTNQFFICNLYIAFFIIFIFLIKKLLKNHLSKRIQYNLWFILFFILTIPFLPVIQTSNIKNNSSTLFTNVEFLKNTITNNNHFILNSLKDFSISINTKTSFIVNHFLTYVWIIGMIIMVFLLFKSIYNLYNIKKSSSPLQNEEINRIYQSCLLELNIKKSIPIYSTIFLESPILTGIIKPYIVIPTLLVSDFSKEEMRYILLHELNHYIYKDHIVNFFMNLFSIIYWFNPFIWFALNEMKIEREIACDSSTLQVLNENEYIHYGYTLINFAKKSFINSFPFTNQISGHIKQIKRRIISISNFKKDTLMKKIKSIAIYCLVFMISLLFIPTLSINDQYKDIYSYSKEKMNIMSIDYSDFFKNYEGSFVLYDSSKNIWKIFDEENASLRISPHSTYKIYDALLGLENHVITPNNSIVKWNNQNYPFKEWESDQDLNSAMKQSVNWYFQFLDASIGFDKIHSFLQSIQYGNQMTSKDIDKYWTDFSLKISPIEQVELLQKFHDNKFGFSKENIDAVKDSLYISTTPLGLLYGKTGTGRVNNQDVSGWFIGYFETSDNIYYFATNIQGNSHANGSKAANITSEILSQLNIMKN